MPGRIAQGADRGRCATLGELNWPFINAHWVSRGEKDACRSGWSVVRCKPPSNIGDGMSQTRLTKLARGAAAGLLVALTFGLQPSPEASAGVCTSQYYRYDIEKGSGTASSWCTSTTGVKRHRVAIRCEGSSKWYWGTWAAPRNFSTTYCASGKLATGSKVEVET